MKKQTENSNLPLKLLIRKKIINEAKFDQLHIIDCCTAKEMIWENLKKHYDISSYLPFDIKPQLPGTIKMDSKEALRQMSLSDYNVIDIDTFGEPWEHFYEIINKINQKTAVFLTYGRVKVGGGNISNFAKKIIGIPLDWKIPITDEIVEIFISILFTTISEYVTIEKVYKVTLPRVSYYGIILNKKEGKRC